MQLSAVKKISPKKSNPILTNTMSSYENILDFILKLKPHLFVVVVDFYFEHRYDFKHVFCATKKNYTNTNEKKNEGKNYFNGTKKKSSPSTLKTPSFLCLLDGSEEREHFSIIIVCMSLAECS